MLTISVLLEALACASGRARGSPPIDVPTKQLRLQPVLVEQRSSPPRRRSRCRRRRPSPAPAPCAAARASMASGEQPVLEALQQRLARVRACAPSAPSGAAAPARGERPGRRQQHRPQPPRSSSRKGATKAAHAHVAPVLRAPRTGAPATARCAAPPPRARRPARGAVMAPRTSAISISSSGRVISKRSFGARRTTATAALAQQAQLAQRLGAVGVALDRLLELLLGLVGPPGRLVDVAEEQVALVDLGVEAIPPCSMALTALSPRVLRVDLELAPAQPGVELALVGVEADRLA